MIRNLYLKMTIHQKFTLVIILTLLIPFIILASAFSSKLYKMIVSETIKDAQEASAYTAPQIEEVVNTITEKSMELSTHPYYQKLFYAPHELSIDTLAKTIDAKSFQEEVANLDSQGIKVRLYLSVPEMFNFYSENYSKDIFLPVSKITGTYWHGIFQGTHCASLYCPMAYLGISEREELGSCAYITYMTLYYKGTTYPCYMALYYDSDIFCDIMNDYINFAGGVSYIINEREEIISTTNEALSSTYRLDYSDIQNSLLSSNSFIERNLLGSSVYVAFYYISQPGWFLVTVIPEAPLLKQSDTVILRLVLVLLLCAFLAFIIASLQSYSITSRISTIIHQMSQVRNGPPVPIAETAHKDEVGELISTYNYMAEKMQSLISEQQKTAEDLRFAEFNALQAQINPHFLYNTMDMINWMAKEGRNDEVSEIVQRLSRYYKLTLSRKNKTNSIADEIEHVTIYVQLQNMRHGDPIDFVVDMPDELTNFSIPKLTLQPIVENAIIHGILEKEEKSGTILITGWEEDDDIVLLISDDGVGMTLDKLEAILSAFPIGPTKGSNVAIGNIHERIKLFCGQEYGLSYSSTLGQGTEVTLRIPKLIG